MYVAHSCLLIDFISFWFETHIDGVHRFDTFIDYLHGEWYTCSANDGPILIRGPLKAKLSDEASEAFVKEQVDQALAAGRIK